jgi:hypothetical protein
MKRWLLQSAVVIAVALASVSCVEREVVVRRPPCPGGVWFRGFYDAAGFWHPPHWQCPRVVEVVR